MPDASSLLPGLLALHDRIRDAVVAACESQDVARLAAADDDSAGDTIYAVDRVSEAQLIEGLSEVAAHTPMWLVAEGLPEEGVSVPAGIAERECPWRVLVDPIDGTRGLMFQKRPAWILTGVAPNTGRETRLRDIVLALQTEIPLLKQHLSDQLWAARGERPEAFRWNRLTRTRVPLALAPSMASTLDHGFASIVRFFPGVRGALGAIDDDVMAAVLEDPGPGKARSFEDQYASTGGQLYELISGHDRFIADLRALLRGPLAARGKQLPLCCHPYDLCTWLVATAFGVELTDEVGDALDAPFDVHSDVCWVGYANGSLRAAVEPALHAALARHGVAPLARE